MRKSRKPLDKRTPIKRKRQDMLDFQKKLQGPGATQKERKFTPERLESMVGKIRTKQLIQSHLPEEIETIIRAYNENRPVLDHLMTIRGPKAPLRIYEVLGPKRFKAIVEHLMGILPKHFDMLLADAAEGRSAKMLIEEMKNGFASRSR